MASHLDLKLGRTCDVDGVVVEMLRECEENIRVNLNMLIKMIYFEQESNYHKVTLKDLENFKEEDLKVNQN